MNRPSWLSWNDPRTRAIAWQVVVIATVCALIAMVGIQTAANLEQRGIASGFDYLHRAAGFEIAAGPLSYSSRDSYARALALALVNTLRVALLGILIATALGLVIGVARLSKIWVVSANSESVCRGHAKHAAAAATAVLVFPVTGAAGSA